MFWLYIFVGVNHHHEKQSHTATMTKLTDAEKAARASLRAKVLKQMAGGVLVCAIPAGIWWYYAVKEREALAREVETRIRVPNVQDTYDMLIEKCQPGDVILFDRRCEKCAAGVWSALSCLAQKQFLCNTSKIARSVDEGRFDHIGKSLVTIIHFKREIIQLKMSP